MASRLVVLGPQRPDPNLPQALATAQAAGSTVMITAGWRHDENDNEALRAAIGPSAVSLPIYTWFEELAEQHPAFAQVYRARQARVKTLKELHLVRMGPALATVRELLEHRRDHHELVEAEIQDAVRVVRELDDRFLAQTARVQAEFAGRIAHAEPPLAARRREQARQMLRSARAICIAGGHVGVLRNRMGFFGLNEVLAECLAASIPVVAWSAGAMALARRVVLFNDDTPKGAVDDELLDSGAGLAEGLIVLPHARKRLHLSDADRLSLLATRFAPARCVGLECGAWLEQRNGVWISLGEPDATFVLRPDGSQHRPEAGMPLV